MLGPSFPGLWTLYATVLYKTMGGPRRVRKQISWEASVQGYIGHRQTTGDQDINMTMCGCL